ncbi:MAG: DUF2461 domain-containing protein [Bacteroidales bacterium]
MDRIGMILDFLGRLRENNCKEWFDAHRGEYKQVRKLYEGFIEELLAEISLIDPTIAPLMVKDCTYRINRDVRFSLDKSPYKTHLGAYIVQGGKKSGYAGYYLHLEPECDDSSSYLSQQGSMLIAGIYAPEKMVLKSIREEILDNGAEMQTNINNAKDYALGIDSDCLKRTPRGYPTDTPHDHLLRLKHIHIDYKLTNEYLSSNNLATKIANDLRPTLPLIEQLNRAVKYAYEEML